MNIEKLSELKEAGYNPRRISPEALKGLQYSLEEFGDLSGIVVNKRTGNLVAGHQRVKALKERYGDLVVTADTLTCPNGYTFRIRVVDWDIKKEKAANIAANALTIQGQFTNDLNALLEEVALELPEVAERLSFGEMFLDDPALAEEVIERRYDKFRVENGNNYGFFAELLGI